MTDLRDCTCHTAWSVSDPRLIPPCPAHATVQFGQRGWPPARTVNGPLAERLLGEAPPPTLSQVLSGELEQIGYLDLIYEE